MKIKFHKYFFIVGLVTSTHLKFFSPVFGTKQLTSELSVIIVGDYCSLNDF